MPPRDPQESLRALAALASQERGSPPHAMAQPFHSAEMRQFERDNPGLEQGELILVGWSLG